MPIYYRIIQIASHSVLCVPLYLSVCGLVSSAVHRTGQDDAFVLAVSKDEVRGYLIVIMENKL